MKTNRSPLIVYRKTKIKEEKRISESQMTKIGRMDQYSDAGGQTQVKTKVPGRS